MRKTKREQALLSRRQKIDHENDGKAITNKSPASVQKDIEEKLREAPSLIADLNSHEPVRQFEAARKFRKLLSIERHPPIDRVIQFGVVPRLISFLTYDQHPQLQFEAAWALTNIASGTAQHTEYIIENNAVPIFVNLLKSPAPNVREQAVWALGNIAGDSTDCRNLVLNCNALNPLLALCGPEATVTMLRNATWALSNFCRGKPQPNFEQVSGSLPVLAQLLRSTDVEVLADACWALSYLSDDNGNQKIQAVIHAGVAPELIRLLLHPNSNVQIPALRTVGNIVTGDDMQTQTMINGGALPNLQALLTSDVRGIKKESCWTISNITAGNATQIEHVIRAGMIPYLVDILNTAEFEVQKEACWALSNATSGGTNGQKTYLAECKLIPAMANALTFGDARIVQIALEGIENILIVGKGDAEARGDDDNKYAEELEDCGGLDKLEELQRCENPEIYKKIQEIMSNFYEIESVDAVAGPEVSQGGAAYVFGQNNVAPTGEFNF